MTNLTIKDNLANSDNPSVFIPSGAIIQTAKSYTRDEAIANGRCPCDGRSLNTYTYRNLHKIISNKFGGTAYSAGVTDQPGASTTFNVPKLMPTSSDTEFNDARDEIYVLGSNTPSAITSTVSSAYHTHTVTSISGPTATTNNVLDTHTHTVAARTYTTTVNANSHTYSTPSQSYGNPSGSSQRNDGTTVGSGLAHLHNMGASNTRTVAPTSSTPSHDTSHAGYISTETTSSVSKAGHSHTATAVSDQTTSGYALAQSFVRVVYYIKL